MANIKAVIFDMDGVMTETSHNHYLAWFELAKTIGIDIDQEINERLKGISRLQSLEIILEHGGKAKAYTEAQKLALTDEKNKHYVESIKTFGPKDVMAGILPLMVALRDKGIPMAIASASKSAPLLVELLDIKRYIDYIVDPTTVPGKPQPDIFLKAAQGLGVAPNACIGIEDAQSGIQAIKAAGMFAVGVGQAKHLLGADLIFETTDLINYEEIERCFHASRQLHDATPSDLL